MGLGGREGVTMVASSETADTTTAVAVAVVVISVDEEAEERSVVSPSPLMFPGTLASPSAPLSRSTIIGTLPAISLKNISSSLALSPPLLLLVVMAVAVVMVVVGGGWLVAKRTFPRSHPC